MTAQRYLAISTFLIGGLFSTAVEAQEVSASVIAERISQDSGLPSENYATYANSLYKTLSNLSPEQFAKVFSDTGYSQANDMPLIEEDDPETDEETDSDEILASLLGMEDDELDNDDFGSFDGDGSDQSYLDAIDSGDLSPGQLKNVLVNASPLSDAVLSSFLEEKGEDFAGGLLLNVLMTNAPLSDTILNTVSSGPINLSPEQLATLAAAHLH